MLAAGVNYVDNLIISGRYQIKTPTPFVPGFEFVGRIVDVADDVARDAPHLTVGTRVLVVSGEGGYAEQTIVPAHAAIPVPDEISDGVAATFVQSYLTAVFALRNRARAERGQSLLVLGAGSGVGLAAVDVGASMGLRVFAAASSEEKRQLALDKGAEVAFDVLNDDIKAAVRELVAAEGKTGVDLVYDPVGGDQSETWLRTLGDGGQYLVIGFVAGIPSLPLNHVLLRNRQITGVEWGSWAGRNRADNEALLSEVMRSVAAGQLHPVDVGLNDLHVELTGFYSDYDNMTSQCTLTAGCTDVDRAFNGGRVLVWGAEAAAGYTFRAARLSFPVQAAYTYTGSSFQSAFASADPQLGVVHVGDRLPYVPEHQVSVSAAVEMRRRWGVSLQGTYVGEMREEASQGDAGRRTDSQWLLDVMANWRPLERVTVFVRGENLLLQTPVVSRRPWGARPGRPFQAQVGIRIEL